MYYTDLNQMYSDLLGKNVLVNKNSTTNEFFNGEVILINDQVFKQMEIHYKVLYEFVLFRRKIEELRENYSLVFKADETWKNKLEKLEGQDLDNIKEKVFIDINRLLNNFIVSFKTLMADILEKHKLPKIFGENSEELNQFKLKTNEWYEKYFSYRFFTRLRDFSVHYDLPLQIVGITADFSGERKIDININLLFKKSVLLQFKDIKNKFKVEFETFNEEFELKPILEEFGFFFSDLYKILIKISGNRYLTPAKYFKTHINQFSNPITVSYGKMTSNSGIIDSWTKTINIEAIDEILKNENQ